MEFRDVLEARYSVRWFKPDPVPEAVLQAIVEDAGKAPSAMNGQEWRVWIATGESLEKIRAGFLQKNLADAKRTLEMPGTGFSGRSKAAEARIAAFSKSREDAGLAQVKVESQNELFHAPAVVFLTIPKKSNAFTIFDLGGFEQTLMLAAASRGVGSIPALNLVTYPEVIREAIAIPEDEAIAMGVALGYPERHPLNDFRSTRAPLGDFFTLCR